MSKDNFDDIRELFSSETDLPETLSKENVTKRLEETAQSEKKKNKTGVTVKRVVATAAAFAVVAASAFSLAMMPKKVSYVPAKSDTAVTAPQKQYPTVDIGIKADKLSCFKSEDDIKAYFKNLEKQYSVSQINGSIFSGFELSYDKVADKAAPTTGSDDAFDVFTYAESGDHSMTNTQVSGVDEADIIKNDGRYLYIIKDDSLLTIVDTRSMSTVYSQKIEAAQKDKHLNVSEIYQNGNTLVVIGSQNEISGYTNDIYFGKDVAYDCIYPYGWANESVSIVYDISDKSAPKEIRRVTQDGYNQDSRMVGSVLYTVSCYNVRLFNEDTKEKYIPNVNEEKIGCDRIYVNDADSKATDYIVLTAYDTAEKDSEVNSLSVLGTACQVFSTSDAMYIMQNYWKEKSDDTGVYTKIHSFSLNATDIAYKSSGIVPGSVDDQYSVDVSDGFFRVATTDYDYNQDTDISSMYVLDGDLNVIGKIEDIAHDEQIKSVRYIGNTAYVVTFRNTDPLFAIDLSDPSKPTVLGQVKLPGFSEYLHPVADGLLLGIGYNGDDENADFCSVNITLFDISDPKAPKVADSHIIKNASSAVNYDPKAFVYDDQRNTVAIPLVYDVTDSNAGLCKSSYQLKLITIKDGKLTDKINFAHEDETTYYSNMFRGAYIGDMIYTISARSVCEFDRESGKMLRSVIYDSTVTDDTTEVYICD